MIYDKIDPWDWQRLKDKAIGMATLDMFEDDVLESCESAIFEDTFRSVNSTSGAESAGGITDSPTAPSTNESSAALE